MSKQVYSVETNGLNSLPDERATARAEEGTVHPRNIGLLLCYGPGREGSSSSPSRFYTESLVIICSSSYFNGLPN